MLLHQAGVHFCWKLAARSNRKRWFSISLPSLLSHQVRWFACCCWPFNCDFYSIYKDLRRVNRTAQDFRSKRGQMFFWCPIGLLYVENSQKNLNNSETLRPLVACCLNAFFLGKVMRVIRILFRQSIRAYVFRSNVGTRLVDIKICSPEKVL